METWVSRVRSRAKPAKAAAGSGPAVPMIPAATQPRLKPGGAIPASASTMQPMAIQSAAGSRRSRTS